MKATLFLIALLALGTPRAEWESVNGIDIDKDSRSNTTVDGVRTKEVWFRVFKGSTSILVHAYFDCSSRKVLVQEKAVFDSTDRFMYSEPLADLYENNFVSCIPGTPLDDLRKGLCK